MTELRKTVRGNLLESEPMSNHTTLGIGGPAWAFITPKDEDDLGNILRFAYELNIPVHFVGSGSNLLVADEGVECIVITLEKSFTNLSIIENRIVAQSGVMLGHLIKECMKAKLTGLESMIGVPGTLGGAIKMNAGAFGSEISTFLQTIRAMTMDGRVIEYTVQDLDFGYRYSSIPDNEIILGAEFELVSSTTDVIQSKRANASKSRKDNQPLRFRSAGSVFKNPPGDYSAGYLIDKSGLKGTRIGNAEISEKHGNFFLNRGNATSADMVELIRIAQKHVQTTFDILLELEIKTLGIKQEIFSHG